MRFGEFYSKVCHQLREAYGWRGVTVHLQSEDTLLDIIYTEYEQHKHADILEWPSIVVSTAFKVDQAS